MKVPEIKEIKTSRTESKDYLYNSVHDLIQAIYEGIPTPEERREVLGKKGHTAFADLDHWLGHS